MLELVPRPVAAHVLLAALVAHAPEEHPLGVWLRGRPLTLVTVHGSRRRILLVDGDLGRLLRRCSSIAVQSGVGVGADVVIASADELIRARALRVVAGFPYLPGRAALRALFPDALERPRGIEVPLAQRSAEEVLAACTAARAPIRFSRVVYSSVSRSGEAREAGDSCRSG